MKDELLNLVATKEGYNLKLNTMREYLQAFLLRILFKSNFFESAAFLGGTCLRFIHGIKRFSEDLDFSRFSKELDFDKTIHNLIYQVEGAGYTIVEKIKQKSILSAAIKFKGLLYEAGMSNRKEEIFSIKIVLDPNPLQGAHIEQRIVNKHFMFGITCYDLPTLLAGKINAILTRNYTKGRDYYDVLWFLATHSKLEPNLLFLQDALRQFNWPHDLENVKDWRSLLIEKLHHVDWQPLRKEMENLIEDSDELLLFTLDNLLKLLEQ